MIIEPAGSDEQVAFEDKYGMSGVDFEALYARTRMAVQDYGTEVVRAMVDMVEKELLAQ